jgi:hypothetical protein
VGELDHLQQGTGLVEKSGGHEFLEAASKTRTIKTILYTGDYGRSRPFTLRCIAWRRRDVEKLI